MSTKDCINCLGGKLITLCPTCEGTGKMPTEPAMLLRAAARIMTHRSGTTLSSREADTTAKLLVSAAIDFDMVNRINSRDPYNDGKTRVMPHVLATEALFMARAILGLDLPTHAGHE